MLYAGGRALPQAVQGGGEFSLLVDIPEPSRHGPEQVALGWPCLNREVEQDDVQRPFPISTILMVMW